jgi:hypothetical protein
MLRCDEKGETSARDRIQGRGESRTNESVTHVLGKGNK